MITYSYTPVGGGAAKTITLIDDDRHWPDPFDWTPEGLVEDNPSPRAPGMASIGRGNVSVRLRFEAYRVFGSTWLALKHAGYDLPAANGTHGTLTIAIPGGALRWVGCGLVTTPARQIGVGVRVQCHFKGPLLTLL